MNKIIVNDLEDLRVKMDCGERYVACINKYSEHICCSNQYAQEVGFKNRDSLEGKTFYDWLVPAHEMADKFVNEKNEIIECKESKVYFCSAIFAKNKQKSFVYKLSPVLDYADNTLGIFSIAKEMDNNSDVAKMVDSLHGIVNTNSSCEQMLYSKGYLGLSHNESLCLFWLLRGKSIKKIAVRLCVSKATVEVLIESIKNKLRCKTRSEIFDAAADLGLLSVLPLL